MGAGNAMAAYARWAGHVPPLSMQLLTYMALVSLDSDERPWFGLGHAALAEHALGRRHPTRRDIKAVERAIQPLLDLRAITADRKPAPRSGGGRTVRYRLHVGLPSSMNVPRNPGEERPPETVHNVPRNSGGDEGQRPPESVHTSPGNRGSKEEEEYKTSGASGGVSVWGPSEPEPHAHAPEAPGDPYEDDRPPSDPAKYLEWMRRHRPNSPWLRSVK